MAVQGKNVSEVESQQSTDVDFPFWLEEAHYKVPGVEYAKKNETGELEDLGRATQRNDSFKQLIADERLGEVKFLGGKYSVLWKKSIWSIVAITFVCIAITAQLVFCIHTDFSYFESHGFYFWIFNSILIGALGFAIEKIRIAYDVIFSHKLFVIIKLGQLYEWKKYIKETNRVLDIYLSTQYSSSYIDKLNQHFEDERASSPEFISTFSINRVKVSEITGVNIKYTYLARKCQIFVILVVFIAFGLSRLLNFDWLHTISHFLNVFLILLISWKVILWLSLGRALTFFEDYKDTADLLVYLKGQKKPVILSSYGHSDYAMITEKYLTKEISIRLKNM